MGFEIFSRKIQRGGNPAVSFTTHGRMAFNKAATKRFEDIAAEQVFLMWDKEKHLIGVRPTTKKDKRAYKVNYGKKGNGCGFSASTFLKYVGYKETDTNSFEARWDEEEVMFVIEVPEQYLNKDNQQPFASGSKPGRKKRIEQPET